MKKIYLLSILFACFHLLSIAQTTYTITTAQGAFAFTPDSIMTNVGDQVVFNVDFTMHPLQEVSAATWAANGATPLAGGFSANTGSTISITMTQPGIRYYVCTFHNGFGMKGRIFVSSANGIEVIPSLVSLPYPNPASHLLHIISVIDGDLDYAITDMLGQDIMHSSQFSTAGNPVSIDMSDIAEGSYILTVTNVDGSVNKNRISIRH